MAQVSFSVLYPKCTLELPGVPLPLLDDALNDALIELCRHALCWRSWQTVPLVADAPAYALTPPTPGAEVVTVTRALMNGMAMEPTPEDAVTHGGFWAQIGTPRTYFLEADGQLRVAPIPNADAEAAVFDVQAAFAPALGATTGESTLLNRFGLALANGAKARLMLIPGKAWSNPEMAAVYQGMFLSALDDARIETLQSGTRGSLRMQPRPFGY